MHRLVLEPGRPRTTTFKSEQRVFRLRIYAVRTKQHAWQNVCIPTPRTQHWHNWRYKI